MKITKKLLLITLFCGIIPLCCLAQKTEKVHGTYKYLVDDKSNMTFEEARTKAIENARIEAVKEVFGTMMVSDIVVNSHTDSNGNYSSELTEVSHAAAKGDWMGDSQQPQIDIIYDKELHTFIYNVEVWGEAREIKSAKTELDWKILREGIEDKNESATFNTKDRIYISFQTPSAGYVAIYLLTGDDEASCLLPYRSNKRGTHEVKNSKRYVFFDKSSDPTAVPYTLSTNQPSESDVIYFIYSPNPFTKCNDVSNDPRRPNTLNVADFQKWLLKAQHRDKQMVVERKWVNIVNKNINN